MSATFAGGMIDHPEADVSPFSIYMCIVFSLLEVSYGVTILLSIHTKLLLAAQSLF